MINLLYATIAVSFVSWLMLFLSVSRTRRAYIRTTIRRLQKKKHIDVKVVSDKWGDLYGNVLSRFYDEMIFFFKNQQKIFKK
jgi:hypothetical protein